MIQVDNLSIQFGDRYLFHDINFVIREKDRIGLVGKNGAGKSTLLKILIDEQRPDEGNIQIPNNTDIGYLPQEMNIAYHRTIYEETATAFDQIQELKSKIELYEKKMAETTDYESPAYAKVIEQYSDAQDQMQRLGGLNMRATIEKVLKGLGFVNGDFDRPMTEFSGGWQMRIELAKLLLRQPHFILLDEPTNHLDIESIMWLEQFLKSYPGGIVLISHDQEFLDKVGNRTMEIVQGKVYDYSVSYFKFLAMREQRREKQITEKKKQEKWIAETKVLIEKFRAKKNDAKLAQTLIRKLEKVEPIVIDEIDNSKIKLRFPPAPHSGKVVVKTEKLRKSYDTLKVLDGLDFELERGEKVAFVGKNGEGKSTFSEIIAGRKDYEGELKIGHQVQIGYFEQHMSETLDPKKTVFEIIDDVATGDLRTRVRSLLGSFLFSGEDVDKKVSVLSGGEKTRLALCKLLLDPISLLILDEPTNHLDIQAKEILKATLRNYEGTLIVVSHDREFLKGLTDKVYEFRNKNIKPFFGDISVFLEERKIETLDALGMTKNSNPIEKDKNLSKEAQKQQRMAQRELEKDIKRQNNKVSKSEKQIAEYETKIEEVEKIMAESDFYMKNPKANEILEEYEQLKKQLETEMEKWETLTMELEERQEQKV